MLLFCKTALQLLIYSTAAYYQHNIVEKLQIKFPYPGYHVLYITAGQFPSFE